MCLSASKNKTYYSFKNINIGYLPPLNTAQRVIGIEMLILPQLILCAEK